MKAPKVEKSKPAGDLVGKGRLSSGLNWSSGWTKCCKHFPTFLHTDTSLNAVNSLVFS